jgi:hypothetical protein
LVFLAAKESSVSTNTQTWTGLHIWEDAMTASSILPFTHLGFCTDGHPGQVLGIAGLLKQMDRELFAAKTFGSVWIATPSERHGLIREALTDWVPESRLCLIDANTKTRDRYFVQLGLSKIFCAVGKSDYVVCLDYDHIVFKSIRPLLEQQPSSVVVSSETRKAARFQKESLFAGCDEMLTLNTSFIWGRADRLGAIGELWVESYEELAPFLPIRNLVEYAFGLAALRAASSVERCSCEVQGNMSNRDTRCIVFHYGGDDCLSLLLKEELYREGNLCVNGSYFGSAVERVDRFLKAHISPGRHDWRVGSNYFKGAGLLPNERLQRTWNKRQSAEPSR